MRACLQLIANITRIKKINDNQMSDNAAHRPVGTTSQNNAPAASALPFEASNIALRTFKSIFEVAGGFRGRLLAAESISVRCRMMSVRLSLQCCNYMSNTMIVVIRTVILVFRELLLLRMCHAVPLAAE